MSEEVGQGVRPASVLVVCFFAPSKEPLHAGELAITRQVERLSSLCSVTVLAGYDQQGKQHDVPYELLIMPRVPRRRSRVFLDYLWFCLKGLSPGRPLIRGFRASGALDRRDYDLIILQATDFAPLLQYIRARAPRVPIVVVAHDVITQSLRRRATRGDGWRGRLEARMRLGRVPRQERVFLNAVDLVVTFSEKDRALLRDMGVHTPIHVMPPTLEPPVERSDTGKDVIFVGAFDRRENEQGAIWLLDQVWPRVVAECPDAHLWLVGTAPPPTLMSRAGGKITVTGTVGALAPYYASASVAVAPLLTGAGIKFKTAQALAHGVPVVATAVGAEGLGEAFEPAMFVRDDALEFAGAVVRLLRSSDLRRSMGRAGLTAAAARFQQEQADEALAYRLLHLALGRRGR